ncbi:uncharacterized protein LOC109842531 [Asparagus officinalis]|uniref:uncharacterized protein LOC109842531 n=1 Tax=Asparagus officinalis TaxID=4686 RepID=UPI00098E2807|nr:uncharacterized protein LOC109842531 [Asparagus officinalis]
MELYSLKMEEGTAIQDHINAFNQLVCQLMNIDEEIKEEEHELLLLSSLSKSYKSLVQSIIVGKQTLKFDNMTAMLRENKRMMGKESASNGGESAVAFEGTDASNTWVLDSAASIHVCNNNNYFDTLKTDEEFDDVIIGNNEKIKVEGVESVRLKLHTGNVVILRHVRYVPSCGANLISLGEMASCGYKYVGEGEWCKVYEDGDLILQGRNNNHIFYLDGRSINGVDDSSQTLVHKGDVKNNKKRVSFLKAIEALRDFLSREDMLGTNSNSKSDVGLNARPNPSSFLRA